MPPEKKNRNEAIYLFFREFNGKGVSMRRMARVQGLDPSHFWRIIKRYEAMELKKKRKRIKEE